MYAVVKTGGKQYRVAKDDVIIVEKLAADAGSALELDEVLILDDGKETVVGTPLVDGARVAATVL
ncbi:50S ribosomal protein L21, partial [bacterium]|nr:50S ribosomal protein L21 [bacterium]